MSPGTAVPMSTRLEDDNSTPSDGAGEAGAGFNFLNHFWAEIQNRLGDGARMMSGQSGETENAEAKEIEWEVTSPTLHTLDG